MAEKKEHKKPKVDFKKLSKDIASVEEKQHIDQIGPAVTEAFIKHAKYKDEKGVTRYKSRFDKETAEKIVDEVYNALAYHSHRRIFGIGEKQYEELAKFKDPLGNPYIDVVTQHHYRVDRESLKRALAGDDKNTITDRHLQAILDEPLKYHRSLLTDKLITKEGIKDPEHLEALKHAIDDIVKEFNLSKKRYNTKKMSPDQLIDSYVTLSQEHYRADKE